MIKKIACKDMSHIKRYKLGSKRVNLFVQKKTKKQKSNMAFKTFIASIILICFVTIITFLTLWQYLEKY